MKNEILDRLKYRSSVKTSDTEAVADILRSSGFFYDFEIDVAKELVEDRLEKGDKSEYYFLFGELDGRLAAYTCFGPIACTVGSFDLYWIAAHEDFRGKGIGKEILLRTEKTIKEMNGRNIYIETSSRDLYKPTQGFYKSCGYIMEAVLENFYSVGDSKIVFSRNIQVPSL